MNRHILFVFGKSMQASIVDLRYKTNDILKALSKNENVTVLYHGKAKAIIKPIRNNVSSQKVKDHPFFGINKEEKLSVLEELKSLRKPRYDL